jgi:hypothetical protein
MALYSDLTPMQNTLVLTRPPLVVSDSRLLSSESANLGYRDHTGNDEWVLTKDGWVSKIEKHDHDGLTRLFRLLRTNDIHKLGYVERPIGTIFRKAAIVSLLVSTIGVFLIPFYWGFDAFLNGCASVGISDEECYFVGGQGSNFEMYLMFAPVVFQLVISLASKFDDHLKMDTMMVEHKGGTLQLEDSRRTTEIIFLWIFAVFWRASVDPLTGGLSQSRGGIAVVFLLGVIYAVVKLYESVFSVPKVEEIRFGTLREFFEEIKNAIGMSEEDSGSKGKQLIDVIGDDIEPIKKSIEKYRDELEKFDDEFEDMWESPSYWMGIVSTRTTTENMLKMRLRRVNASSERKGRGFTNYMDALNNLEDPPSEIRHKMRKVRDSWDHAKDAKKEDYIVTLRDAQSIIEWNYANPPQNTPSSA